jgi:4-amino-4-deoxy-L-arabinose transferase-like glycosyltransferase
MTATFLLVLVVGFGVMALIFLLAARGLTKKSKWLGLAAIIFAAPFFFWLGAFSEQFTSGQCYSRSIHLIANAVARTDAPAGLAEQIRSLPLYGYETVCSEVEVASEKLPNAGAP